MIEIFPKLAKKLLTKLGCGAMIYRKLAYANYIFAQELAYANCLQTMKYLWVLSQVTVMNLKTALLGREYTVQQIDTDDNELNAFLFSLGCYSGEPITVISRRWGSCTVSIKDGRYNIDNQLAEAILVAD